MSRKPTEQQQACVTAISEGVHELLKIEACAGSGKTSTLTMMAEAYKEPSLYLAFNKVTANEANRKFPRHVTCKTTHSVAYAAFGAKMAHKLSRPKGGYVNVAGTGSEIARYFAIDSYENREGVTITANFIGLLVRDTVARFEQSADDEVQDKHIPVSELKKKLRENVASVSYVKGQVLNFAKQLWAGRIDMSSPILATHDTYLKMYQLSKPVFKGFKVVYVDEFQDTTPCVLDIIMNQRGHMRIVTVGDARQAIYGWRGAVNAMQMVKGESFFLTKSFRYGQRIADLATTVLENDLIITGNEVIDSVAGPVASGVVDESKPYTRLFRTNAVLLAEAIDAIDAGIEVSIEIDVKDFTRLLLSCVALYEGDKKNAKHDKVLAYQDWDELLEDIETNPEMKRIAKVINEGKADRWLYTLERHVNSSNPHITFTTAHKSKGREWSQVRIESDFKSCYGESGDWTGLPVEEQNLLYVAVTRAIDVLEFNSTVQEYLNEAQSHSTSANVRKVMKSLCNDRGFDYGMNLRGEMAQEAFLREEQDYLASGPDSVLYA